MRGRDQQEYSPTHPAANTNHTSRTLHGTTLHSSHYAVSIHSSDSLTTTSYATTRTSRTTTDDPLPWMATKLPAELGESLGQGLGVCPLPFPGPKFKTSPGRSRWHRRKGNYINLSSRTLSHNEIELLSMGLTFIPVPQSRVFHSENILEDIDNLNTKYMQMYHCTLPGESERTLGSVCMGTTEGLGKVRPVTIGNNLPEPLRKSLHELRNNTQIVRCKADKGDVTVVMDSSQHWHGYT